MGEKARRQSDRDGQQGAEGSRGRRGEGCGQKIHRGNEAARRKGGGTRRDRSPSRTTSGRPIYHPDSLRYFAEFNRSANLGIAFAPHHLLPMGRSKSRNCSATSARSRSAVRVFSGALRGHDEEDEQGDRNAATPRTSAARSTIGPIVKALRDIGYSGFVEIFMHPMPRGIPILPTAAEITAAINKSRAYVEKCLAETA